MEEVQKGKTDLYKIGHRIILKSKVKNLRASRRQWGKKGQRMRIRQHWVESMKERREMCGNSCHDK